MQHAAGGSSQPQAPAKTEESSGTDIAERQHSSADASTAASAPATDNIATSHRSEWARGQSQRAKSRTPQGSSSSSVAALKPADVINQVGRTSKASVDITLRLYMTNSHAASHISHVLCNHKHWFKISQGCQLVKDVKSRMSACPGCGVLQCCSSAFLIIIATPVLFVGTRPCCHAWC